AGAAPDIAAFTATRPHPVGRVSRVVTRDSGTTAAVGGVWIVTSPSPRFGRTTANKGTHPAKESASTADIWKIAILTPQAERSKRATKADAHRPSHTRRSICAPTAKTATAKTPGPCGAATTTKLSRAAVVITVPTLIASLADISLAI